MRAGTSLPDVARYNQNVVIHAFRRMGPSSQTDVVASTGLSAQTVSTIVRGLVSGGMLREIDTVVAGRGRPKTIMDIVGSARFAVGVHADPSLMTAVVLDLRGSVVGEARTAGVDTEDPERAMDEAAGLATEAMTAAGVDGSRLEGACLAAPGPVDARRQCLVNPVWLPGWAGAPIGQMLGSRLGMPVPLVKDTLAAVIGENWVRGGQTLDSTMVFVYLGAGTGLGISVNGEPLRGASGNAGEVGSILVALSPGGRRIGDGLDNDPAVVVEKAHGLGILGGEAPPRTVQTAVARDLRRLCEAAASGNADASRLLGGGAARIADVAAMAAEMVDADMVVFGGPYWQMVAPWYEGAAREALGRPSARGPHAVEMLSTAMGEHVGAVGAASVVLDDRFVPRTPRAARS
jgi:predicted NBD/HSP70 family sugar kinase